ncbi:hypothetical protein KIPB_001295 [Kipferlia bialata]|uniref:IgGFc-binding protein N-terminal domain-containing protein n=1 Tax=Kipferlia bialata TaxID=797122 RepID=A0A9K3GFG5_9EUKA|nr:hypothetical protein KIPB_001295 [Kipferlia bialata]|eukprot:g1295.t1
MQMLIALLCAVALAFSAPVVMQDAIAVQFKSTGPEVVKYYSFTTVDDLATTSFTLQTTGGYGSAYVCVGEYDSSTECIENYQDMVFANSWAEIKPGDGIAQVGTYGIAVMASTNTMVTLTAESHIHLEDNAPWNSVGTVSNFNGNVRYFSFFSCDNKDAIQISLLNDAVAGQKLYVSTDTGRPSSTTPGVESDDSFVKIDSADVVTPAYYYISVYSTQSLEGKDIQLMVSGETSRQLEMGVVMSDTVCQYEYCEEEYAILDFDSTRPTTIISYIDYSTGVTVIDEPDVSLWSSTTNPVDPEDCDFESAEGIITFPGNFYNAGDNIYVMAASHYQKHWPIGDVATVPYKILASQDTSVMMPSTQSTWAATYASADGTYGDVHLAIPMRQANEVIPQSESTPVNIDYVFAATQDRNMSGDSFDFAVFLEPEQNHRDSHSIAWHANEVDYMGYQGKQLRISMEDTNIVEYGMYFAALSAMPHDTAASAAVSGQVYAAPQVELMENQPVTFQLEDGMMLSHYEFLADYADGIEVRVDPVYTTAVSNVKIYASQTLYIPTGANYDWISISEGTSEHLLVSTDDLVANKPVYITIEGAVSGSFDVVAGRIGTVAEELYDGIYNEMEFVTATDLHNFIFHPTATSFYDVIPSHSFISVKSW